VGKLSDVARAQPSPLLCNISYGKYTRILSNQSIKSILRCQINCEHAVSPDLISRHLRDKHQVKEELQKQANEHIKQ
jgi:hypothetical protein